MPPAALSAPTRGDAGPARGGGGSNQGRNANTNNAAAANANAPPPEEPLADGGILPRDAALIKGLLRSMGALEHEPSVVPQLLDFLYRYVSDTLADADAFAEAAGVGGVIAPDHVSLALAAREARNAGGGAPPPSLAALTAMAAARNAMPLPALSRAQGLHPPPDADALLAQGYSVPAAPRELTKKRDGENGAAAAAAAAAGAAGAGAATGSGRLQAPRGGGRASRRRGIAPAPGNKLDGGGDDDMVSE